VAEEEKESTGMAYTIVVLIKQVSDMNAVRVDHGTGKPILSGQQVINSLDEYAIEEALQLREHYGGEVIAMSAGPASVKDALTRALAMGADRAVQIPFDNVNELDTLGVAKILAEQLKQVQFDIVLTGQNSDDYETGHVPPQIAEILGLPQVSSVTKLEVNGNRLTLSRDTEDGTQVVEVETPVLLMAMTGLNEPRYPSLKGIMAAKKKPLDLVSTDGQQESNRLEWSDPIAPERTSSGTILQDVPPAEAAKQLVGWLKEQKLI
jgi:electron transfer flavoprotein beta subunit